MWLNDQCLTSHPEVYQLLSVSLVLWAVALNLLSDSLVYFSNSQSWSHYAVVWPETLSFSLSYQSKGWKYKVSPGLEFQSFGKWIHFIEPYQLGKFTIVNYQSVKERNWKKLLSMFSLYYLEGKSMSWRDF